MAEQASDGDAAAINARIFESLDALTKSERRLAEVVLESVDNLPSFTASELAARANVSNRPPRPASFNAWVTGTSPISAVTLSAAVTGARRSTNSPE